MLNYGIELEYFVRDKDGLIVPAFEATKNLDGNPVVGEIRTGVHSSITDCIFELKKLLFIEENQLREKGYTLSLENNVKVDDTFLYSLRKKDEYINKKRLETLDEFSVYQTGKLPPKNSIHVFTASIQVNLSANDKFNYTVYNKVEVEDKYRYVTESKEKTYSSLFNYPPIIHSLDTAFSEEISGSKRTKGICAIKDGELGSRLEYRSLPNTVDLDKLLVVLLNKNQV